MRQNPHVRICGGPGSATTLVYPTGEDPIRRAEIRRPVPRAIQNEQVLLDQDRFSHDRPQAAGAHQPGQGGDQVHQQDDRVAHRNILATTPRITKLDNLNGLRAE